MLAGQRTFEDMEAALHAVPFCVLDLETTGATAADCEITEIGAVKYLGGELVGTFQTLVNPGTAIPPFITVLTGITQAMVIEAPDIGEALPAFLEFIGDVLDESMRQFPVCRGQKTANSRQSQQGELPAGSSPVRLRDRTCLSSLHPSCCYRRPHWFQSATSSNTALTPMALAAPTRLTFGHAIATATTSPRCSAGRPRGPPWPQ